MPHRLPTNFAARLVTPFAWSFAWLFGGSFGGAALGPALLLLICGLGAGQARGASPEQEEPTAAAEPPNLLILLPDQWRGRSLGFLGEEAVITPHLDRLAEESLVLTDAVSNYPVCSPYRAMFMTGKYPFANGVLGNCNSKGTRYGYELRLEDRCWSDVLADQGYSLGYIGKWHLEAPREPFVKSYNNRPHLAWNEWTPPERRHGFGFWYAYNTFDQHLTPQYWTSEAPRDQRVKVTQWSPEHEVDQAIRFLENEGGTLRQPEAPFALVVAMNPPHTPYAQVPSHYLERYDHLSQEELLAPHGSLMPADSGAGSYTRDHLRQQYAAMTGVDEQVGRILAALEAQGLTDDTIVLFTSDHGDCLGLHGEMAKNQPYEESVRVPFLLRWPGRVEARHDDLLISVPDLYPTLLGLMGFGEHTPESVEGRDLSSVVLTGEGPRPSSQLYLRVPHDHPEAGWRGVRTARYTLVIERSPADGRGVVDSGTEEVLRLYDNHADPFQLVNLAAEKPELVERLREEELEPWLARTGDPWGAE